MINLTLGLMNLAGRMEVAFFWERMDYHVGN